MLGEVTVNGMEHFKVGKLSLNNDFLRFDCPPEVPNFRNCNGYWHDIITNAVTGEVSEVGHSFNIITEAISKLAAARFRGGTDFQGIQMWAVGSGSSAWDARWDSSLPPAADAAAARLVNEIGRLPISISGQDSYMVFVDQNGNPTDGLTNRLLVRRQFGRTEVNGDWREFAIFGGNANETRNSGIMINHKIHRIITKTPDMTVERNIIFTFN